MEDRNTQIKQLEDAIIRLATRSTKQVQLGSRTVTYYELDDLRAALRELKAETAAQQAGEAGALPGFTVAVFDRR